MFFAGAGTTPGILVLKLDADDWTAVFPEEPFELQGYLAGNPSNAQAELAIARAYHWKKNFSTARAHYEAAAAIDPHLQLEIVPLLDETSDWTAIIALVAPFVDSNRTISPSLLGPLASAYHETHRTADANRIRDLLASTPYKDAADVDYQHYVLAECSLWAGDREGALRHLRAILNRSFLEYARTDDKFRVFFADRAFLDLTK